MYFYGNPFLMMCFFFSIFGNILSVSSMSWIGLWLGMELNLFGFLILTNPEGYSVVQSSIVYFVIQSAGSMILLFGFILVFGLKIDLGMLFIVISLLMKSGMFPFHSWVVSVVGCSSWVVMGMVLTWQKFSPFVFFSFFPDSYIVYTSIICMCVVGCLGGLNQNSVRLMAVYSSFVHNSWLLVGVLGSFSSFIIYFLVYSIGLIFFFFSCFLSSKCTLNSYLVSLMSGMSLLVLSGVPPFIGFFSKMIIFLVNPCILLIFCILCSVVSLKFYLTFFYSMMMSSYLVDSGSTIYNFVLMVFCFVNAFFISVIVAFLN
nr:NADH dehydrogenase subunit 2 [Vignadula atrata]